MKKKKNSKIKEYWNEKGKSLCFKILHIVCYVLSLGFIILCVYACANTNNKDNKQENVKKGLYLEQPKQLTIDVDRGLYLSSIDEEWFNRLLMVSVNQYIDEYDVYLQNLFGIECFIFSDDYSSSLGDDDNFNTFSFLITSSIYDAPNNYLKLNYSFYDNHSESDSVFIYSCSYSIVNDHILENGLYSYVNGSFDNLLSYVYSHNLYLIEQVMPSSVLYEDIYQNYINYDDQDLFNGVADSMSDYIDTIGEGLESSVDIFYDEDNSQLTSIGWLSVIVVAVGLSWTLFSIVSGLIRLRG